jgi:hypothetical protein
MKPWPKHPVIYEINTWVWLRELSQKHKRSVSPMSVAALYLRPSHRLGPRSVGHTELP